LGGAVVPYGITAGPDGNVWFTDHQGLPPNGGGIGRVTTSDSVTIAPLEGRAGTNLTTIKGAGFQANEFVAVSYALGNQTSVPLCPSNPQVASDGTFSCTGSIPTSAGGFGTHTVKAKGQTSGITAKTVFLLTAM
jgi:hypothetical protein